jgi:hypothetical protein
VKCGCLATWTELLKFHAIWIVATILLSDVVALFAINAGHGDFRTNVRGLACHDLLFLSTLSEEGQST